MWLTAVGVGCPGGMTDRRVSGSDMARRPRWRPPGIRCNTTPKRFVLRLIQVSDLKRVTQFWDTRRGCVKQVVGLRGNTDRLLL